MLITPFSSLVPLITPFDESGRIDFDALAYLLDFHLFAGSAGFVCFGTTGESPTLEKAEKIEFLRFVVQRVKGRALIIANTGSNATAASVSFTKEVISLGADACMAVVPYYNRPTERGCVEHFRALAAVGLPLIVYHIPGRTQLTLSLDALCDILSLPHVIGIKECSRDFSLITALRRRFPSLALLSGSDEILIEEIRAGANGSIGAIANIIPRQWSEILATTATDLSAAIPLYQALRPLIQAAFSEVNPQGVKYATSLLGLNQNVFRLPLVPVLPKTEVKIAAALQEIGLLEGVSHEMHQK